VNKKIYLAGSGGMLGSAFYEVFKKDYQLKCTDISIDEDWLEVLDFRDFKKYQKDVLDFNPNYLFHLGAITSLEECELNITNAYATNTKSVENATQIANELSIPIIYISTAGIFDGKKDSYDDWDKPNPLGHYAKSKFLGEQYVQSNAIKYLICRAGWMMGGGPKKDKKFINKIIKQINTGVKELNIVNDKFGTPTYTLDFAKNLKLIVEKELWGLYNLVCEGFTSREEVTREILNYFNLHNEIKINLVNSNFFSNEYFAPRPYSERLINSKLNKNNLNIMRDWKICLNEYLSNYDFLRK
tara:strand:+ start:1787 stop:2686 length:900 start_codon:yes stop_codon:yes gene_type:complete